MAYASHLMSETKQRHARIEKDTVVVSMGLIVKSSDYTLGHEFHIDTDHKPLVPLLGSKQLDRLPP